MRRIALIAAVAALLTTAAAGSSATVFPDTIALPNGWLPEGIAIAPGGDVLRRLAREWRRVRRKPANRRR